VECYHPELADDAQNFILLQSFSKGLPYKISLNVAEGDMDNGVPIGGIIFWFA
jgi:hypothetical protein